MARLSLDTRRPPAVGDRACSRGIDQPAQVYRNSRDIFYIDVRVWLNGP